MGWNVLGPIVFDLHTFILLFPIRKLSKKGNLGKEIPFF